VMSELGMAMMGTGTARGEDRARLAAEAAISSPLLEDINLHGARGVLVNITAGLDMSIGEFEAVGDVIKTFITETATVVVGTVIDPNLTEEMRVTVVVTGLSSSGANGHASLAPSPVAAMKHSAPMTESKKSDGTVDYEHLERPTILRQQAKQNKQPELIAEDMDYLDIPAFLRRKEDV
jgi:cell division protein FtsZ